jgi:hypothetical protein
MPKPYLTNIVIAGLDPAIQGGKARSKYPWMPGSSPGMTQLGLTSVV